MLAPVPIVSSSGCACTNRIRRAGRLLVTPPPPPNPPNLLNPLNLLNLLKSVRRGSRGHFTRPCYAFCSQAHDAACDDRHVEYPELAARTRGFRSGEPRAVTVSADGSRVAFLRSAGPEHDVDQLWVFDVPTGTERLICDPNSMGHTGIRTYATDIAGRIAAFSVGGTLVVADLVPGGPTPHPTHGPVADPRPDPQGLRGAYA